MIIRSVALVMGLIVLSAYGSGPEPSATVSGSLEATASAAPVSGGMPPGCEPIDLRSSTGERVDLTGEWEGTGALTGDTEVASFVQLGDCVYGTVGGTTLAGAPDDFYPVLTILRGRIHADFTIPFEVVIARQDPFFRFAEYSTVPMVVEWDEDGRIRLREDRELGTVAPRCAPLAQPGCPDPILWYRIDEAPLP